MRRKLNLTKVIAYVVLMYNVFGNDKNILICAEQQQDVGMYDLQQEPQTNSTNNNQNDSNNLVNIPRNTNTTTALTPTPIANAPIAATAPISAHTSTATPPLAATFVLPTTPKKQNQYKSNKQQMINTQSNQAPLKQRMYSNTYYNQSTPKPNIYRKPATSTTMTSANNYIQQNPVTLYQRAPLNRARAQKQSVYTGYYATPPASVSRSPPQSSQTAQTASAKYSGLKHAPRYVVNYITPAQEPDENNLTSIHKINEAYDKYINTQKSNPVTRGMPNNGRYGSVSGYQYSANMSKVAHTSKAIEQRAIQRNEQKIRNKTAQTNAQK